MISNALMAMGMIAFLALAAVVFAVHQAAKSGRLSGLLDKYMKPDDTTKHS